MQAYASSSNSCHNLYRAGNLSPHKTAQGRTSQKPSKTRFGTAFTDMCQRAEAAPYSPYATTAMTPLTSTAQQSRVSTVNYQFCHLVCSRLGLKLFCFGLRGRSSKCVVANAVMCLNLCMSVITQATGTLVMALLHMPLAALPADMHEGTHKVHWQCRRPDMPWPRSRPAALGPCGPCDA